MRKFKEKEEKEPVASKWFGNCRLCGVEAKLQTTLTSLGDVGIKYYQIRMCDECLKYVRQAIDNAIKDCMYKGVKGGDKKE